MPISCLQEKQRFNKKEFREKFKHLPRATFYNRVNKLEIKPDLQGFYSQDQIDQMNLLDTFLRNGAGNIQLFRRIYNADSTKK